MAMRVKLPPPTLTSAVAIVPSWIIAPIERLAPVSTLTLPEAIWIGTKPMMAAVPLVPVAQMAEPPLPLKARLAAPGERERRVVAGVKRQRPQRNRSVGQVQHRAGSWQ